MAWDKKWDEFYKSSSGDQYPDPFVIRFVARNFYHRRLKEEIKILDLGCGSGSNLWYLSREGFTSFGIDGSDRVIKKAKEKLDKEDLKADLRIGDFRNLPYQDNAFNAVIDGASIQHNDIPSIKKIISEVMRVLKTEGKFFGLMILEDNSISPDKNLSNKDFFTHFSTKEEVRDLFKNFKQVTIDTFKYSESNEERFISFLIIEAVI